MELEIGGKNETWRYCYCKWDLCNIPRIFLPEIDIGCGGGANGSSWCDNFTTTATTREPTPPATWRSRSEEEKKSTL